MSIGESLPGMSPRAEEVPFARARYMLQDVTPALCEIYHSHNRSIKAKMYMEV